VDRTFPPGTRLRTAVFAAVAVLLIWLVISRSLVLYLADVSPRAALWFNPQQSEALLNIADSSLNANSPVLGPVGADQGSPNAEAETAAGANGAQGSAAQNSPPNNPASNDSPPGDNAAGVAGRVGDSFQSLGQDHTVDLASIRAAARSALITDPLNPRALRLLGQAADAAGQDAEAVKFMQAAMQMSLHEPVAVYWLMIKATQSGDFKAAIAYADALMRSNLNTSSSVAPLLAHFAEAKDSRGIVETLLESDPPWRRNFFALFWRSVSDVRTPLDILLTLKGSPKPPTHEEIDGYLTYLIAHHYYDLAYYTWLQFLPAEQLTNAGMLYNGNFAHEPSGLPFDWTITQGSGVSIDIESQPDVNVAHALSVEFLYGRVQYHSVNELILLPPGTYNFAGKYKGQLIGPRGLKWRLACAPNAPIGESSMIGGVASSWKDIKFTFTVPDKDCRAQYVRLDLDARTASEEIVTGSMLFSDLNITRVNDEPDDDTDSDASSTPKSSQ
jgi:hypothetical protein